jgi:Domain of unknown function (DUF4304)
MGDRETVILELKRVVQPHLRALGFSGSFPHFRKIGQATIDLVTFQFDRSGTGFVIEIARCPPEGIVTHWGERILPNKTKAWDVHPKSRKRIQPKVGGGTDAWFRFDKTTPSAVAAEVLDCLLRPDLWLGVGLHPQVKFTRPNKEIRTESPPIMASQECERRDRLGQNR